MAKWDYGGAYERHPCESGTVCFCDGSIVKCHDIFKPLPQFMYNADVIFTDGPWNAGNIRSFYTKSGNVYGGDFQDFYTRLFECVSEISPKVCYLEIGKEYLAEYIFEMRKRFCYVTFYNSSYYHKEGNRCYIVRGANKATKPKLDGMDEEDIIKWVCENEHYDYIGDLCMGRGLVGFNAAKNRKKFVGTELNHKRLSVLLERMSSVGIGYTLYEEEL